MDFFQTVMGNRFFSGQLPRLIENIGKLSTKQTACNLIAAGILAGNEGMSADGAARRAIETFDIIAERVK